MKKIIIALVALVAAIGIAFAVNTARSHNGPTGVGNSKYNGQAIMFAQMMIPHHEQAIELSDLAIAISKNEKIVLLAKKIKLEQAPEITQMNKWLRKAGNPDMHHSMEMPGYIDEAEISELAKMSGKNFDLKFLEFMIEHHKGAITMAGDINQNELSEVRKLAEIIIAAQSAEIDEMQALIKEIS